MAMESDILRITVAARDLVRHCDEGQAVWLQKLARPLPPTLRDDSEMALSQLRALTTFDPFDCFGAWQPNTSAGSEHQPERHEIARPRAKGTAPARHKPHSSVVPFDSRRFIGSKPGSIVPRTSDAPGHKQRPQSENTGIDPAYERSPAAGETRSRDAESAKPETKAAAEGFGTSQEQQHRSVDPSKSKRADAKQKPQTTTPPKPLSRAQSLAAKRKARAKERHAMPSEWGNKDLQPNSSDARAIDAETPSPNRLLNTSKEQAHVHSALRAAALAGPRQPAPEEGNTISPTSPPDEQREQIRQRDNGDPHNSHSGGPIHIEEIDTQIATPPAPAEPRANTLPPERDLARQLADAAQLHGIDLT